MITGFLTKLWVSVFLVVVPWALQPLGQSQTKPSSAEILQHPTAGAELNDVTIGEALCSALRTAGVPGGIVTIPNCQGQTKYKFRLAGETLHDALDAIVSGDPQYTWTVRDGVVNIVPWSYMPSLLDTVIPEMRIEKAGTLEFAVDQLLRLPEVATRMRELRLSHLHRGSLTFLGPREEINLYQQNLTLRDALNAVVGAHGRAVWLYWEKHCYKQQHDFEIEFLVK